jgi:hypothetical protein
MAKETQSDQQKKLDEDEEQAAAKDEPMGSVAAAVPRDAGSALTHKGGHATLVAGTEAHQAEKSGHEKTVAGKNNKK